MSREEKQYWIAGFLTAMVVHEIARRITHSE